MSQPRIKLWTNHGCPWAGRVHIALSALGLKYDEEIIDLSQPRTPEYLALNPRGKVPTIEYNGELLTESGIIATFLADAHPGLLPAEPIERARLNWFVDAYFSNVNALHYKAVFAKSSEEAEELAREYVKQVAKEVEPDFKRWKGPGPFFGGSEKVTLAEALVGGFLLRVFDSAKAGLLPKSLLSELQEKAPRFYQYAQAVTQNEHVRAVYDEESIINNTRARVEKAKAA